MNNATSIVLRSAGLCSRTQLWPQPGQWLRNACHASYQSGSRGFSLRVQQQSCFSIARPISSDIISPARSFSSARQSFFQPSAILHRLKKYDPIYEEGLHFRKGDLTKDDLSNIFGDGVPEPDVANRLLRVLHARRVDGTLDIRLDEELLEVTIINRDIDQKALDWLRATYPIDEDAALEARFQREDMPREQEHPSALTERGQRLGLFKTQDQSMREDPEYYGPQSGQYYAPQSEKEGDVFGRSAIDRIRAANEAKAEEEERLWQARVDQSMAEAEAKEKTRSQALEKRPEQGLEVSEGTGVRPPNSFERWVIRAREEATSKLTLESPEIANRSNAQRILPSLLFVLACCGGLYLFTEYWEPPRRTERMFPDMSLAMATCVGIATINVLVFVAWRFPPALKMLNRYFVTTPAYPYALSMLGNTFSQHSLGHLFSNMLGLFIFGPSLHEDIGRANFIAIYIAAGLFGSVVSLSTYLFRGILFSSHQGASGSVWGIMAAYLWLHKDNDFSFIFIPHEYQQYLAAKGWFLLAAFLVLDTISGMRKKTIDVVAHRTGLVTGVIATALWRSSNKEVEVKSKPSMVASVLK